MDVKTVLVTGGSGFVGSWALVELIKRGHRVRTTVRSLAREHDVRAMVGGQVDPAGALSFHVADLSADAGWDEAVDGCDIVLHVASPMPTGEFRGQDVIGPARQGTRRVLEAAVRAGVRRVVLTSSTSAAMSHGTRASVSDETVWTDLADKPIYNYPRSKTLAEQDAWAFANDHAGTLELTTVLPSQIQGPVLGSDYSASIDVIGMMLRGKMPLLPRLGFGIVDVRDLIELHLLAMTSPAAAGERFIGSGEFLWFADIARILREELGERASKVPTRRAPDLLVRIGALFNAEMKQLAPNLGVRSESSSAKAEELLGWRARPVVTTIVDTAVSLFDRGLV